ncbi:MAG: MtnX-like HAD-IB family phosphatase [Bacteroidota bacterium]|nr:MtnX-like HAD-IB family phosphatase [Bacteroidota bacterium]
MSDASPARFRSRLPEPTVRIFTDFDGTITPTDVGEELFRHFCGDATFERIRGRWSEGVLTAPEAYGQLSAAMGEISAAEITRFLGSHAVEESFPRFVHWCAAMDFPLYVLSDGADAYILPLLEAAGVDVPVLCNRLEIREGRARMYFPYFDRRCPEIAHCKSNHVALLSRDEDVIVYVGDGSSDFEAAQYADLVFARGTLERYCQEQNITFHRFYTFAAMRDQLANMLHQNTLRRRKRAELRRQQLWSAG